MIYASKLCKKHIFLLNSTVLALTVNVILAVSTIYTNMRYRITTKNNLLDSDEMLKGYMARESLGTLSFVKLTFFIQSCCEPVHITVCSAKTLIFHRCNVFVGDHARTYEKYKW